MFDYFQENLYIYLVFTLEFCFAFLSEHGAAYFKLILFFEMVLVLFIVLTKIKLACCAVALTMTLVASFFVVKN